MSDIFETPKRAAKRAADYAREGDVWALMQRADELAILIGYHGDTIDMLDDAMTAFAFLCDTQRVERARTAYRAAKAAGATTSRPTATERPDEAHKSGNTHAGAQPAYQSRGALGPRNPSGRKPV